LLLEKKGESFEIIRTRDPEIIKNGDYVFDVGGIYDEKLNLFDHHQTSFKDKREDGILYSSFGLVWKKFGKELTGSEKIAKLVDGRLAAPVDAYDNGFDLVENKYDVSPYLIQHFFLSMRPTWMEKDITNDEMFLKCVEIAKVILTREIIQARDSVLAEESVILIYQNTQDKRIIVLDKSYPYEEILDNFSEPLFVVYPRTSDDFWGVKAARTDPKTFKNRKDFPANWAGLRDEELQKIAGVPDAVFCHRGLFMAVAKSKEGAIELAQKALLD
jgi:uncharacterized UPF0160 family protein